MRNSGFYINSGVLNEFCFSLNKSDSRIFHIHNSGGALPDSQKST